MKWVKRIYYRLRIKRRLKEVATGVKRKPLFSSFAAEPLTPDDLLNDDWI